MTTLTLNPPRILPQTAPTRGKAPADAVAAPAEEPAKPQPGPLARALKAIDKYTSPRENTGGNFEKSSYFQAVLQGGVEGFYLLGPVGILTGVGSSAAGVAVEQKSKSRAIGALVGSATGAALAAGAAAAFGSPVTIAAAAVGGGLLGALQTCRGDSAAKVRDSSGGGTLIGGAFLHGPAKMAAGIAGACGVAADNPWAKAALGAGVGLALGAGLGALGFTHGNIIYTALGSAAAGAIGPFFGPRFSQTFRNLAQDIGHGVSKLAQKTGLSDKPMDHRKSAAAGAIPSAYLREFIRGAVYSDGSLSKMLIGSTAKAVQLAHIMYFARAPHDAKERSDAREAVAIATS